MELRDRPLEAQKRLEDGMLSHFCKEPHTNQKTKTRERRGVKGGVGLGYLYAAQEMRLGDSFVLNWDTPVRL